MREEKFESIMEAVCDMCHWPYLCGEALLDEKCADCPAEKKIRELMEGYERGLREARAVEGDLISRKALLEKAVEVPGYISKMVSSYEIATAPAIAVEPVRPGKWESIEGGIAFRCSRCGYTTDYSTTRYCPNCGARMDGDGDG